MAGGAGKVPLGNRSQADDPKVSRKLKKDPPNNDVKHKKGKPGKANDKRCEAPFSIFVAIATYKKQEENADNKKV